LYTTGIMCCDFPTVFTFHFSQPKKERIQQRITYARLLVRAFISTRL